MATNIVAGLCRSVGSIVVERSRTRPPAEAPRLAGVGVGARMDEDREAMVCFSLMALPRLAVNEAEEGGRVAL
jgi:hypothetical protein